MPLLNVNLNINYRSQIFVKQQLWPQELLYICHQWPYCKIHFCCLVLKLLYYFAGDRVAIEPGIPCRRCILCKSGRYNICKDYTFYCAPYADGSLCQYFSHPSDFCFKWVVGWESKWGVIMTSAVTNAWLLWECVGFFWLIFYEACSLTGLLQAI